MLNGVLLAEVTPPGYVIERSAYRLFASTELIVTVGPVAADSLKSGDSDNLKNGAFGALITTGTRRDVEPDGVDIL
jgi:hypothetical protein